MLELWNRAKGYKELSIRTWIRLQRQAKTVPSDRLLQKQMITKDSIETAYSFLHQKQRIYVHSTLDWQKDDIEIAIASFADEMNQELLDVISGGRADFLRDHKRFKEDITKAVLSLESVLEGRAEILDNML